jgi:hypothetical protein
MSSREKAVRRARRIITDQQLLEFFRTIRNESGILAVELICDHLEEGLSLDAIFYTGEDDGFSLSVKARGKTNFKITFGCLAGPEAGDGGEWHVAFDDLGHIVSVKNGGFWLN